MGQMSWKTLFFPEFDSGGLSLTRDQIASRLVDNAESPETTATISAAWTGTNVTVTRETAAPLNGEGSIKVVVAGGAGSVYHTLDRAKFGYPFPGHNGIRIRYVKFRMTDAIGSDVRFIFGDSVDANHYRYWTKTIGNSKYVEYVVDLDPDNTESNPAPTTGSTAYDPEAINRFGFSNLTSGNTYYIDDIEFIYEYSLVDTIGFPTEAPVDIGDVGSLHARVNGLWANVKSLEGQTQQYAKQGISIAEIGQALQWAIELNSSFSPPTTTEIVPGNYQIDRIRGIVTTNLVASTPASESAGTIYATYTPAEADWNIGDTVKVTFSGGYVRTDVAPTELLTATVAAGGTTVTVDNAYQWEVGWLVRIYDDDSGSEWHTISSIDSPTTFSIDATVAEFTVVQNAGVTRAIRTDLSTAIFFTMLQASAQNFKILATGTFTTSSQTIPADTGRTEVDNKWNGCWLMPITGSAVNEPRLIADFANAGGIFSLDLENAFTAAPGLVEYIILGNDDQLVPSVDSASNQTPAHVTGNKTDTIPAMNLAPGNDSLVRTAKAILERIGATPADPDDSVLTNIGQRDDTATSDDLSDVTTTSIQAKLRRILLRFSSDAFSATIQGAARTDIENMLGQLATYFSDSGAAWSVQINNNVARTNLEQVIEDLSAVIGVDGANIFDPSIGGASRTTIDAAFGALGTALGAEFDGTPDIFDTIVTGYDSTAILANEDGSIMERLEDIDLELESLSDISLADYDNFDVADADANTERWDVGYISGTEGGSADINTTTAGKLRISVDPDVTPTAAGYGVHLSQFIASKYFSAIIDVDSSFSGPDASWAAVGMRVSPTTYDTNNVIYIQRQASSGGVGNRFATGAILNGVQSGEVYYTSTDSVFSLKIERFDNVWRCYYSLTQSPNFVWVLLQQYEDPSEFMDSQQSIYLDSYSPGTSDGQTAVADFDNFKLYITQEGISQEIAGDYDSSAIAADEDGAVLERLEQIQEAVNRGSGTSIAANKSLVDALGSDGNAVADSAITVLGAIGADNNDNAFSSSNVAENGDGSVLERLEEIRGSTTTGTFTLTLAMGTTEQTITNYTPLKLGKIAILLDLATLVTAGEGGNVISRLKFMIDGVTLRIIDRADFLIGTDEVHPTVSGFVVEGASFVRLTIQVNSAVSVNRDIPWRIIEFS